jgi:hypothetical protein
MIPVPAAAVASTRNAAAQTHLHGGAKGMQLAAQNARRLILPFGKGERNDKADIRGTQNGILPRNGVDGFGRHLVCFDICFLCLLPVISRFRRGTSIGLKLDSPRTTVG